MSFEILRNNPALIRNQSDLNELIEKYNQQKLELIRLGELISEQSIFMSEYKLNGEHMNFCGPNIIINRFFSEATNRILKYDYYQENWTINFYNEKIPFKEYRFTEPQFLKLFEIDQ